jgi:hypothetical protein
MSKALQNRRFVLEIQHLQIGLRLQLILHIRLNVCKG